MPPVPGEAKHLGRLSWEMVEPIAFGPRIDDGFALTG